MELWNNTRKVIVSREEVDSFRQSWPCNNLRSRSYWFEFDNDGSLIDSDVPYEDDGDAADALAQDALNFLNDQY